MTKQELMETYTAEQLAKMVASKQNIIDDMKSNIDFLNSSIEQKERIINQIYYILEKLFGVRHDTVDKPYDFEKILSERIKGSVTDFLPTEPIKVADMLINTTCARKKEILKKHFIRRLGIIQIWLKKMCLIYQS